MIQELIQEEAGADLRLHYPRNGEYRSAIIMDEDLTGDGNPDGYRVLRDAGRERRDHDYFPDGNR